MMAKERDWPELPFAEALAYLRSIRPMSDEDFADLEVEIAATSFVLSRVTKMNMLQWVLDKLDRAIQDGQTIQTFDAEIEKVLSSTLSPAQIDTIFTSSAQYAFGAGTWDQGTDPGADDSLWGWEYVTQHDDRVRPTHEAMDGLRFATGEGKTVFPPWEWGCRCTATWITKTQAGENAVTATIPGSVERALDDSTYASPALDVPYVPDLVGFNPSLLADYLNDQALVN